MKTLILIFLTTLIYYHSYAQDSMLFQKRIGGLNEDIGNSIKHTPDKGFIICGSTKSFGNGYEDLYLIKTDSLQKIQWTKTLGKQSPDFGVDVIATKDSGFIAIGTIYIYQPLKKENVLVYKLNYHGDTVWTKTFGDTLSEYASKIIEISDSNYLLSSYMTNNQSGLTALSTLIDKNGNIIWSKSITSNANELAYLCDAFQTNDKNIMQFGYISGLGFGYTDIFMCKSDSNGNNTWTKSIGDGFNNFTTTAIQSKNGHFLVATRSVFSSNSDMTISKIDSLGNIAWTKIIDVGKNDYPVKLFEDKNNDIIILLNSEYQTIDFDTYTKSYILKLNSNGQIVKAKKLNTPFESVLYDFCPSDDGFWLTGKCKIDGNFDVYIVKADTALNMGCYTKDTALNISSVIFNSMNINPNLSSWNYPFWVETSLDSGGMEHLVCDGLTKLNELPTNPSFSIHPNPFTNQLQINKTFAQEADLLLYDGLGKLVVHQKFKENSSVISTEDLPNGLYFYTFINAKGERLQAGKLMKE